MILADSGGHGRAIPTGVVWYRFAREKKLDTVGKVSYIFKVHHWYSFICTPEVYNIKYTTGVLCSPLGVIACGCSGLYQRCIWAMCRRLQGVFAGQRRRLKPMAVVGAAADSLYAVLLQLNRHAVRRAYRGCAQCGCKSGCRRGEIKRK